MVPPQCPIRPTDVLPNERGLWDTLLHPVVEEYLGECLARPDVAGLLNLQAFTLREADQALQHLLPPLWARGSSVFVAWQDGVQVLHPPENFCTESGPSMCRSIEADVPCGQFVGGFGWVVYLKWLLLHGR